MAFDLQHDNGLLRVVYSGMVTVEERHRALSEAFGSSAYEARRRVLVDFRGVSSTPPAKDFETTKQFVDLLARETKGSASRVAYLTESAEPIDRTIELLIDARRIPIRRFVDEREAIDWLSG